MSQLAPISTRWRLAAMALCAGAALAGAAEARAGGFLIPKIGGDTAGPSVGGPAAIFWNPGAIGLIDGTILLIDNNFFLRSATFTRDTTGAGPDGQLFETADLLALNAQPTLAITSDLDQQKFTFGLGLYAPFGASSTWEDPAGAQRFQSIFGGITSIYVSPTAAYSPSKDFHLGASVSYVRTSLTSYRALDMGPLIAGFTGADVPPEQAGNEGRALLDFGGNAFAWSVGAAWNIDTVTLGLSYASEVDITMKGKLGVFAPRNDFFQNLLGGDLDEPATLKTTWPRALRTGATWWLDDKWTLSVNAEWVQWSLYDKIVVDVKNDNVAGLGNFDQEQINAWQDTLGLRMGARYSLSPDTMLFGGFGGESGAIPIKRLDPSIFDATKIGAAFGASWKLSETTLFSVGYNHLFYLPAIVNETEVTPPPTGIHTQQVGVLNTNLLWRLQ